MHITLENQRVGARNQYYTISPKKSVEQPLQGKSCKASSTEKVAFLGNDLVETYTLSNKLSATLWKLNSQGVVLVASDADKARAAMKANISSFPNVIEKVFFIPDKDAEKPIAFIKADGITLTMANLGDKGIVRRDNSGTDVVKPGEDIVIHEDDSFELGRKKLIFAHVFINPKYYEKHKENLMDIKYFDFSDIVRKPISTINNKTIDTWITSGKGVSPQFKIMFSNVGGQDELIKELKRSVIAPMKQPDFFKNTMLNHGIILYGKPGTGKTFVAQALANESCANFYKINASEMDSKWVGGTEENWKKMFDEAILNQPSIIFIDELDAISKKRGGQDTYGDKALNYVLARISQIEQDKENVFIIGATNNFTAIDPALLRAGRMGKQIEVKSPDEKGCLDIFNIHSKYEKISPKFDRAAYAKKLYEANVTASDIAFVVNEARMAALEREQIFDKILSDTFSAEDEKKHQIRSADFAKAYEQLLIKKEQEELEKHQIRANRVEEYKEALQIQSEAQDALLEKDEAENPRQKIGYKYYGVK